MYFRIYRTVVLSSLFKSSLLTYLKGTEKKKTSRLFGRYFKRSFTEFKGEDELGQVVFGIIFFCRENQNFIHHKSSRMNTIFNLLLFHLSG